MLIIEIRRKIVEKKIYEKPKFAIERFMANEYVSACYKCDIPAEYNVWIADTDKAFGGNGRPNKGDTVFNKKKSAFIGSEIDPLNSCGGEFMFKNVKTEWSGFVFKMEDYKRSLKRNSIDWNILSKADYKLARFWTVIPDNATKHGTLIENFNRGNHS